ncbi:hypothetical protein D9M71_156440 [compost metagenome]
MAVDQPPLQGRGERRGRDNRAHGKQGLEYGLVASRVGAKNDRLPRDQQGATGKALDTSQRDQHVQSSGEGGNGARQAHGQRGADEYTAWLQAAHQPRRRHEAEQLQGGVADIQPGKLIGRCRGVADDVSAAE